MKELGIWMDKEKAHIVVLNDQKAELRTIQSELEFYNPKGGSRSKTRWGPQDVVQDSKYLEREKHQLKRYFSRLAEAVKKARAIVIFGPSDTYLKFKKELEENFPQLAAKIKGTERADSMTLNQVKALVRGFFSKKELQGL